MSGKDRETRDRLLEAATTLFAADGFKTVTVRDICQAAGANVAAVNYHFGDKMGLYHDVLNEAIEKMHGTTEAARDEGKGKAPEEKLEILVRVFIDRAVKQGSAPWIHQLMMHEMAEPTPALDLVVERVLRPRFDYLKEIAAELLGCDCADARVEKAAMSVQSQLMLPIKNPFARQLMPELSREEALDGLAAHVVRFSLAGICAMRD
ncbi:MAG: CerR family C-terminal domain-containing protein [Acidobacteriaceae bacterium]|jgi:AcrR family transcriptional regulator|nr:CerR family C-terminal domain-containing protein [Acidobacteriaceae bacterium]